MRKSKLYLAAAWLAALAAGSTRAQPAPAAPDTLAADSLQLEVALAPERYPLGVCAVTGNPLGSMGDPLAIDVNGMEVRLCCEACVEEARQNEASIRRTLTKALLKRDGDSYPLTECLACGEPLPKRPVALVHGCTLLLVDTEACAAGLAEHGQAWSRTLRATRAARP